MRRTKRFTIYDAMDEKGAFDSNPANVDARDSENMSIYKGPVEFPKMFYHPQGQRTIIVPGELESTLLGPRLRDQQSELQWAMAHNKGEEAKLRAEGWHDSPAKAEAASRGEALPLSKEETISEQNAKIKELEMQLQSAKAGAAASVAAEAAKPTHSGGKALPSIAK